MLLEFAQNKEKMRQKTLQQIRLGELANNMKQKLINHNTVLENIQLTYHK